MSIKKTALFDVDSKGYLENPGFLLKRESNIALTIRTISIYPTDRYMSTVLKVTYWTR